jgi:hypothetical protein
MRSLEPRGALYLLDDSSWHEAVTAAQSSHVCCLGHRGRHLLGMSISHFEIRTSSVGEGRPFTRPEAVFVANLGRVSQYLGMTA